MIQRDGCNISLWQESINDYKSVNKIDSSVLYDAVIVGGGITGITAALLLQNAGMNCLVLEAHNLCFGTTGGTTAHINTLLDVPYSTIEKKFNKEKSKLVADSVKEAVSLIRDNIKKYNIDCDFKTTTATLFAKDNDQKEELEKINEATIDAGIKNNFVDEISIPVKFIKALRVYDQAKFNPVRYVYSLAKEFEKAGGTIMQQCRFLSADENENVAIETSKGKCTGRFLIYATHIPPGVNLLHFRCIPFRSYAMAVRLQKSSYPEDLVYDMYDPYHYYRSQEIDGEKYFLVGGEDHKTAHEDNHEYCFLKLESHIRKYFDVKEIAYKWSSQYYESPDGLPYIGQLPGHTKIFTATGYGGNGMPYSNVAALSLKRTICGEENPYQELYDPNRLKPVAGFSSFISHNADVVKQFANRFFSTDELQQLAALAGGEGRIVNFKDEKIAIYKDDSGVIHALHSVCTHAGCEVKWNNTELSWDCPCHGTRYSYDGKVMTGPATKNLTKVNVRELVDKEEEE
ncbi:MAG TPA: FAD-dependent oxidoreductase [Chitinophagaceae bacterium]|nr:FAD-dependent oxidoreductase [Chitinophagaceae bacterium]